MTERHDKTDIIPDIMHCQIPADPLPLVFDSPHSGSIYPADFEYVCSFHDLRRSEDLYVDEFFSGAPDFDACFLKALFPRAYIDVNRSLGDMDPLLLDKSWPGHQSTSPRAHAGIGLIRRLLKADYPIYGDKLSIREVKARIANFYHPYHQKLENIIESLYADYGQVWHVNCHSMPSGGKKRHGRLFHSPLPDFVIGDRDGTSCTRDFSFAIRDFLQGMGYSVALNDPYKGVEIVKRHGRPDMNRHSLQLEINKALYVDEKTIEKTDNFKPLQTDMRNLMKYLSGFVRDQQVPLAAD